ncbi:MAG: hypothetical protein ABIF40_00460 [archaeon]
MTEKITKEMIELTLHKLLKLYDLIIEESGGEKGVRDEGGLSFSIYNILRYEQKQIKYPFKICAFI